VLHGAIVITFLLKTMIYFDFLPKSGTYIEGGGRTFAPLNLEFFVPIFRIASQ